LANASDARARAANVKVAKVDQTVEGRGVTISKEIANCVIA
jgi:hypothetical protein